MIFSASERILTTPKLKFLEPRFFGHGLVILLMIMLYGFTYGQTNSCSTLGTPITVGTSCSYSTFNSSNGTDYWNSANGCNSADLDDAWWHFTATGTSTTITYNPDSRDAILHLFTGSCSSSMSYLACADDWGNGGAETIVYATTIGVQYIIRIQRYNRNNSMTGQICVWSPFSGPPPCVIAPLSPPDGAVDVSIQPTLEWPAALGATSYDVYFGTVPTPPLVSASQSGTTYTPAALLNEVSTYYWTIVPKNSSGDAVGCATWSFKTGEGGCLTAVYGQYPTGAGYDPYIPACSGSAEIITSSAYAGEYSKVEVISGVDYTFKSSVSTDFVTISDDGGTIVYDYGIYGVTWTATITGIVRFYTHTGADCGSATSMRTRSVQCSSVPPPANDECAAATSLPCGTSALAGTTVGSIAESAPGGTASQYGVWYTFTGDGSYTTISSVATFDHEQVLLSGSCGSLSLISSQDGWTAGGTETYSFFSTNGTTYYVYIAHYSTGSTTTGTFTISRDCFPPPANDECADATSLPCATSGLAGTTEYTTIESSPLNQASDYGVWYTFTGDGVYTTISTTGTGLNQEMTIVYGTCGSYTLETTVDATSSTTGTETYSFYPTNGVDYFIYVAYAINTGTSSQTGTFTISRDCFPPPANDACSAATSLPCATSNLAGTTLYTAAETPPSTTSDYGVWYTFTGDGLYTTISSVAASGFDHEMTIGYGSCGAISVVADVDGAGSGGTETYSFYPTNALQYYVFVAHATPGSTTQNTFTISRDCPPAPPNDPCPGTALPCATSNLAGTTVATVPESAPLGLSSDLGVWYTFTGDGVYTTISSVAASGYNHEMTILYGSCGSVTGEASVDGAGAGGTETYSFYPTNGVEYYVYISHNTAGSTTVGTFTISRTCTAPPANDACAAATNLPCATSNLAGTTVATIAQTPPSTTSDHGVWYEFTGDGLSTTISSVAASGFDHEMTVLIGTCGSFLVLSDNDAAGAGGTESYTFATINTEQYHVFIAHATPASTTQGTFTISRTCVTPPPANDECAAATSLPCATSGLAGTTDNTIVESAPGGYASGYGVWYTFTGDGVYTTVSVTGISLDAEITFVSGSCGGTVIASVDVSMTSTGTETYSFTPTNGIDYFVYVAYWSTSGSSSQTGDFTISRDCYPPPANDECSAATSLPCATTDLPGTTVSTVSESAPFNYASDYGVWYEFTGDGLMNQISATGESGFDIEMTVVTGSCSSNSLVSTQNVTGTGGTESLLFYPTNGTQYYVYIAYQGTGGSSTQTGDFTISRVCYPIPSNDECAGATNLPCATVDLDGTTFGVMPETPPSASSDYGVWYEFTGADEATTISSVASFDHEMTIMSGSCGSLTVIANVDSYTAGGTETYTFHADAGTQYYVYVAHYLPGGGSIGTFTISRSCITNDVCGTATAFSLPCGGSYTDDATTVGATNTDNGGTCVTSASTTNATWYSFTGTGFDVTASLCGSGFDTKIFVYSGTCGAMSCVTGSDDACNLASEVVFATTYGTTYYIMATGYSSSSGTYTLTVTDAGVPVTGLTAGSNTTICSGSATALAGAFSAGGPAILWSPSTGLSATNILDPSASPTTNTTYTLTVGTDACASSASVTISVDEPSVQPSSVSGPIGICIGTVAPLTVVGGTLQTGDWQWYTGSCGGTLIGTGTTIDVTPSATTTYYVQAPANGACPATSCTARNLIVTVPAGGLAANNSTATCPMDQNGYVHLLDGSGNLIASVDPQGQNLGNVTATVYVEGSPLVIDHCSAIGDPVYQVSVADRHWQIKTTVAPSGPVKLRLPISDGEVSSLNVQAFNNINPDDQVSIIDDILVTKYTGPNEDNDFLNNCAINGGSGLFPLILQDAHGNVNSYISQHSSTAGHNYIEYTVTSFSEFWMHGSVSGSGLPVEMVNFDANCIEPGVTEVSWQTITENNSSHFELLKSNDGQNWIVMDVVDAAGESQDPIAYSVIDEMRNDIDGIVYYRIEQFDNDGMSSNYNAVSVSCASENSDMIVYPNPGSGEMNILINEGSYIGICSLVITDAMGKTMHQMDVEINKGNNAMHIQNGTLKPGVYFIKVYNKDYTTKTIKYIMTEN